MEIMSDKLEVHEFIISTKGRLGDGKEFPIRELTEVYTKDGVKVASQDVYSLTAEDAVEFAKYAEDHPGSISFILFQEWFNNRRK